MGRLTDVFDGARQQNRAALVIYICAGDPDLETTVDLVVAAADAGADVIELGMPFSDPTADGPAIQRASERSLSNGTRLSGVVDVVKRVRKKTDVPIVLFGYYNPLLKYGEAQIVRDVADAGVDGFLVVDLPPEQGGVLRDAIAGAGLDYVPLVAPTSDKARVALAASVASGFVYYVSMTGVTGAKAADLRSAAVAAGALQNELGLPVALGFGVKTKEDVAAVAPHVAGVVVGSAVVTTIEEAGSSEQAVERVSRLVRTLREGVG